MQFEPFEQRHSKVGEPYTLKDMEVFAFWVVLIAVTIGSEIAFCKLAKFLPFHPLLNAALCATAIVTILMYVFLRILRRNIPRRNFACVGLIGTLPSAFQASLVAEHRIELYNDPMRFLAVLVTFTIVGVLVWRRAFPLEFSEILGDGSRVPTNESEKPGLQ